MLVVKPRALKQQRLSIIELQSAEEINKSCKEDSLGSETLGVSELQLECREGSEGCMH